MPVRTQHNSIVHCLLLLLVFLLNLRYKIVQSRLKFEVWTNWSSHSMLNHIPNRYQNPVNFKCKQIKSKSPNPIERHHTSRIDRMTPVIEPMKEDIKKHKQIRFCDVCYANCGFLSWLVIVFKWDEVVISMFWMNQTKFTQNIIHFFLSFCMCVCVSVWRSFLWIYHSLSTRLSIFFASIFPFCSGHMSSEFSSSRRARNWGNDMQTA